MSEAEQERARIVAYLRQKSLEHFKAEHTDAMFALDEAAYAIERNQHGQ